MKINRSVIFFIALVFFQCGSSTIEIKKGKKGGLFEVSENGKPFIFNSDTLKLNTNTFISFNEFVSVKKEKNDYAYALNFALDENGKKKLAEMSERNLNKKICFVIKDKIVMAPIVQTVIPNGEVSLTLKDWKEAKEIIDYFSN